MVWCCFLTEFLSTNHGGNHTAKLHSNAKHLERIKMNEWWATSAWQRLPGELHLGKHADRWTGNNPSDNQLPNLRMRKLKERNKRDQVVCVLETRAIVYGGNSSHSLALGPSILYHNIFLIMSYTGNAFFYCTFIQPVYNVYMMEHRKRIRFG
jgi:hypothetical protein